ncbi:serine protease inhibitor 2-like [Neocloeon triangulifer]|uniref:serine protease inhibitor 2-like n=1 Tax=Neocloeon triangulifer TaxID=2078957 RepID=UPI00286F14A9|nr:serine protease inhibitor 2-like [Neocloeon triangulifer]
MQFPRHFLGLCFLFSFVLTESNADDTIDEDTDDSSTVPFKQGIRFDDFDLKFCKALYKSQAGNVAVSPVSVKLLLAMIYEGAAGDSAREIQTALALGEKSETRRKFRGIVDSLVTDADGKCELDLSSRLFVSPQASYSMGYRRVLYTHFKAEIMQANFSFPLEAAEVINSWVCNATNERIKEIISPNDPNLAEMQMVLANALFFKGSWQMPFNPDTTAKGDFHLLDGTTVKVDMMRTRGSFYYVDEEQCGFKLIRMPYQGGKYSMYLMLPKEKTGLIKLVEEITPDSIREAIMKMQKIDVTIGLPKFSVKLRIDTKSILNELGINKIFTNAADMPKLSKDNSMHVSKLIHEAGLDVDELGSTAYAATHGQMVPKMQQDSVVLLVNHPFVLFIKDDTTETVVFAAKIDNPLVGSATTAPASINEPQARALHADPEPTPPQDEKVVSLPSLFSTKMEETMVAAEHRMNTSRNVQEVATEKRTDERESVVMRIPPKASKTAPAN